MSGGAHVPFTIPIDVVKTAFPQFEVLSPLTPSEQKAAFHVKDKAAGADRCLKVIAPNCHLDRLHREVKALLEVDHRNVVKFVEYTLSVTKDITRHYIVEDFVEGSDMSAKINPAKP